MFVEFDWMGAMTESPILMVLFGCSVITFGIALERLYYFRKRAGNADLVLVEALEALRKGQVSEAIAHCRKSKHPVGTVAAQTMECQLSRPADTEETMQVALSQQKMLLERSTGTLGTMAAIAPLIGLLGTVWGIMRAFHSMALTGSAAPSVVAAGVAEALVTTAAGLVIAVPAVLLFNHFTRRVNIMLTVSENHSRSLRIALIEAVAADSGPSAKSGRRSSGMDSELRKQEPVSREPVGSLV
ncbi:MAG: MotA/TolQ/ExbB proton channel family protein [Candidatus Krumholzibacteriota bacterium]